MKLSHGVSLLASLYAGVIVGWVTGSPWRALGGFLVVAALWLTGWFLHDPRNTCKLWGCVIAGRDLPECRRCHAALHGPEFLDSGPARRGWWRLVRWVYDLEYKHFRRCGHCRRIMWFDRTGNACCSPECLDDWSPF